MRQHNDQIKSQFDLRASTFEQSVHWVRDPQLIAAHVRMAGKPGGQGLELCCGTGAVARGLQSAGWNMTGVDISAGMIEEAMKHVDAMVGDVAALKVAKASMDLVIMRQAYFLLDDGPAALREVRRVLKPGGRFILSHLVPFSAVDCEYLRQIHTKKQAQMRRFFTTGLLREELEQNGFEVTAVDTVVVRESVTLWMREAPELSAVTRREVCEMVANAPADYKKLRHVEVKNDEILEDWNFVLLAASPKRQA